MTTDITLYDDISDDLILSILSFVDVKELVSFQTTCSRFYHLENTNELWKVLCQRRWEHWPLYKCNERLNTDETMMDRMNDEEEENEESYHDERQQQQRQPQRQRRQSLSRLRTWKQKYQWVETDIQRTELYEEEELQSLDWNFDFLPWAGWSPDGLSQAIFHRGNLFVMKHLWMYPFLSYSMETLPLTLQPSPPSKTTSISTTTARTRTSGVVGGNQESGRMGGGEDYRHRRRDRPHHHHHHDGLTLAGLEFLAGKDVVQTLPLDTAMDITGMNLGLPRRISNIQYMSIATFPIHSIARTSVGGWMIWNENVVFFTDGTPRSRDLPDELQSHMDLYRIDHQ